MNFSVRFLRMDKLQKSILDRRACALSRVIFNLRQDIDIHRVIGINVEAMGESRLSSSFFGHIQKLSHISIALNFCKIFEYRSRNKICSIPALINMLPSKLDGVNLNAVDEYAKKFSDGIGDGNAADKIRTTFEFFKNRHLDALQSLRKFRDTYAVHIEDVPVQDTLPSHDSFEELWEFCYETYKIIHREYNGIGPALMGRSVCIGLTKTLKRLGVEDPKIFFPTTK